MRVPCAGLHTPRPRSTLADLFLEVDSASLSLWPVVTRRVRVWPKMQMPEESVDHWTRQLRHVEVNSSEGV